MNGCLTPLNYIHDGDKRIVNIALLDEVPLTDCKWGPITRMKATTGALLAHDHPFRKLGSKLVFALWIQRRVLNFSPNFLIASPKDYRDLKALALGGTIKLGGIFQGSRQTTV